MVMRRRPMRISEEEVNAYLDSGSSDRVAFLGSKVAPRVIAETLVALANSSGGIALLGVSPRGMPLKDADLTLLQEAVGQATLLTDPPLVLPLPQSVDSTRGHVVVVQVPPGLPHIYSLQGYYLTRAAGQNRPLTTHELRRLLLERGDSGFEAQLISNASVADLDEIRIARYLEQMTFAPDEPITQALLARGCAGFLEYGGDEVTRTGRPGPIVPTVAGMLLFGRNPQQFLRSAEIICVRYAGSTMGDEFVRQDIGGNLQDQIRQAEAFVVTNMRRGMKISGITREETTEYPLPVVREAIVNAVAHRDYSIRGEGIRLLMFNDRMEVYSPGRLPGHVTLENMKDERYSRNEAIVAVLSDMGYIERLGYGIDRMITAMTAQGLPEPHFEETSAGFKVTLQSSSADLVSPEPAQQIWGHALLNERQEQALAFVKATGRITNSDFQAFIPDVSPETIRRDLADLVAKNLLLRIGEKRATYYILK
jgi:ATP-dependent DNA helicase RecG